jgi:hypothetical protein
VPSRLIVPDALGAGLAQAFMIRIAQRLLALGRRLGHQRERPEGEAQPADRCAGVCDTGADRLEASCFEVSVIDRF